MWKSTAGRDIDVSIAPEGDDDWETDPDFVNDVSEQEQRWGSKTVEGSGRSAAAIDMRQLREETERADKEKKLKDGPKSSHGYGGKFGVEKDRMDKSALGHDYVGKVEKHASQKDYSTGFGGKFGVQSDRVDKCAATWEHKEKVEKHASQKDYATGFGGKFGVQTDRVDKSAVGWDHVEKVDKHESQKDYSKGFGGKFGVEADRQDKSAVGWDHMEAPQKHESQLDHKVGFGGKFGVQTDRKDKSALGWDHVEKPEMHESQVDHKIGFGGKFGVQSDRMDKSALGFQEQDKIGTNYTKTKPDIGSAKPSNIRARFENFAMAAEEETRKKAEEQKRLRLEKDKKDRDEAAKRANNANETVEPKKPERKGPINTGREQGVGSAISNFNKQPDTPTESTRKDPIALPKEEIRPVVQPDVIPTNAVPVTQRVEQPPPPSPAPVVAAVAVEEEPRIQPPVARTVEPEPEPEPEPQPEPTPEPVAPSVPAPEVAAAAPEQEEPEEFILSADNPGVQAIALYDYQAAADDEISFDPDDRITHIEMPMNITEYNTLITNIIESAVDELIQKRESGKESLLLHICRLCAKEEPLQLLDLSELHLDLIAELAISGIEASTGCTKICSTCAEFLGRIREFRCRCEEGQKKISSLLAERSVIPDFLNLDFIKSEENYGGFSPPPPDEEDDFPEVKYDEDEDEEEDTVEEEIPAKEPKRVRSKNSTSKTSSTTAANDSRRRVVNGKLQWVCLDCEQTFGSCTKLKKHRQTCEMVGNENSKRRGPFTCDICGQSLPTLMGLRVHVHKHTKSQGPEQDQKSKAKKVGGSPVKSAICHVCGKSFSSTSTLRSHLVFHRQEKRLECQICNKKFHKLYRLKDHLNCHANVRRYSCDICGKAFFTKAILYKHTRSHDQNFRKHPCTMCPMLFAHPYQLRSHMMVHTAEYPHGCKLCPSKFRFTWDLKKHYAKAHPPEPEEEDTPADHQIIAVEALPLHHQLEEVIPEPLLTTAEPLLVSSLPPLPDPTVVTATTGVLLKEHDQHDDLSVMLAAHIPPHQQPELTPSVAAVQPVVAEHPFGAEHLLEEASRDFTTDCFPADHLDGSHATGDDDFYTFMEC